MKKFLYYIVGGLMLLPFCGHSSNNREVHDSINYQKDSVGISKKISKEKKTTVVGNDTLYFKPEIFPLFPGGSNELMRFVSKNLKYPTPEAVKKVQGLVVVRFIIDENGKVTNTNVIKSLSPLCDAEAKRVIGIMPLWSPGMDHGKTVKTIYTMPIHYRLK